MIRWHCPKCKSALEAFNDAAGLKIECMSCNTTVWVPEAAEEEEEPRREKEDSVDEDDDYVPPPRRRRRVPKSNELAILPLVAICFAVGSGLLAFVPVFWCLAFPISGVGIVVSVAAVRQGRNSGLSITSLIISVLTCIVMLASIEKAKAVLRRFNDL